MHATLCRTTQMRHRMYESQSTDWLVQMIMTVQRNNWSQFDYWKRRHQSLLATLQERNVYVAY